MEKKLSLIGKEGSMDIWYDWIKEFTPKSKFLYLSENDFILLRAMGYDRILEIDPYMGEMHDRPNTGLTKEEELRRIEEIEKELDIMFDNSYKFFRTDIFSPKDVGSCIVNNGKDALKLLSNSSRMYYNAPKIKEKEGISLILRDVVNYIEEYRVFVSNEKIVGVSQYLDSDIVQFQLILEDDEYKDIDDEKINLVSNYVHKVINECNLKDVVLDIGIDNTNNYHVVEINPYSKYTNRCLLREFPTNEEELAIAYNIDKHKILLKTYKKDEVVEEVVELKYKDQLEYDMANPPTFKFGFKRFN